MLDALPTRGPYAWQRSPDDEHARAEVARRLQLLLAHHDAHSVRLGAATALGALRRRDSVDALIDALDDADDLVRLAADKALRKTLGDGPDATGSPSNDVAMADRAAWRAWRDAHQSPTTAR